MKPLISVVMSIYNPNEQYLAEQLVSIDKQDWDNLEIIVYNDNPDDADREQFCRDCCKDHGVRYVHGTKNLGYRLAFEQLSVLAKGDYVVFSDQDDVWLPQRISECVKVMEDGGYVLSTCDRQVIDGEGTVLIPSWRDAHPKSRQDTWCSGDQILPYAAFSCFSIGMATMVRRDVLEQCLPFPSSTGHDRWIALCCGEIGPCAYVEKPLVQYRRHGQNVSGLFAGVYSKSDWRRNRVELSNQVVCEFGRRFPHSESLERMRAFADARMNGNAWGIWKNRDLAPQVAYFELALKIVPDPVFRAFLRRFSS